VLLALAGAVYIALVAIYARPIADDWWHIAVARQPDPISQFHQTWLIWSDRFSGFVVLDLSTRLFGALAVNVVPLALLLALWALSVTTMRNCMAAAHVPLKMLDAASLCLLGTVAVVATSPSIYDTLWLSGACFYLGAVVAATGVAAWCAHLVKTPRGSRRGAFWWSLCAGFVASGFHEVVGAVLILAAALGTVTVRSELSREDRSRATVGFIAIAVGSSVGIVLNLLGSGSSRRAADQHAHVNLLAAVRTAGHNLSFVGHDIRDGVLLLALATGIVAWDRLGSVRPGRSRVWLLVWSAFMLLVPWLATSALTTWGGSNESGDRSPFRAGFLETGSVAVAASILVMLLLSSFPQLLSRTRAMALTIILLAGGVIGLAHKTGPMLTAERMRIHALDLRAASVAAQLKSGRRIITVTPAPLLTVDTQVYDLSFAERSEQRGWIVQAFRIYYRIPQADRIEITDAQPRRYCRPNVTAPWAGVQSCQALAADR